MMDHRPLPDPAAQYERLLDAIQFRFAQPGGANPRDQLTTCLGLPRDAFQQAVRSARAWCDTLGDDPDPATHAAAIATRPPAERAVLMVELGPTPTSDPDPVVERIRRLMLLHARLREVADAEDAEVMIRFAEEVQRAPESWVRAQLPLELNHWLEWLECTEAQRARLVAVYAALREDAEPTVRAAVAQHAPEDFPRPPADDPSPLVRAVHPETPEDELFAIARHPDPALASAVIVNGNTPHRAHLVLAYRFGVPYGRYEPRQGIACEHEIGLVRDATGPDALVAIENYWWPDELIDPSSEVEVEYEWHQPGGTLVEARMHLRAPRPAGFTSAELLFAVLRRLEDLEAGRRPHFEGDRHGLGKQICLFQLTGGNGRWQAALRK